MGPDEVTRLTKDGFLLDRIDKKMLFSQKQNYLNELNDPEGLRFTIGKRKFSEQGQERWIDLDQSEFPKYELPDEDRQAALDDFNATAVDKVKTYTDYAGRPIFLRFKDFDKHTKGNYLSTAENRQKHYFTIAETISAPDEVYFSDKSVDGDQGKPAGPHAKLTYTYLKFYDDDTVLATQVEFSQDQPQLVRSWYQVRPTNIDQARVGLLIHKKLAAAE